MNLMYINWNPDPIIFSLGGFSLRWYSVFWVIAIASASIVVHKIFKKRKMSEDDYNKLFVYSFLGILVGARLGHCLFYDFAYYSDHLLEIVLPVKFLPDGSWKFTGYAGLASHGGTMGLMLTLYLFCRKTRITYLQILDIIAMAAPLAAGFIRIANLMNSEIIGMPTLLPFGFIFEQVDSQPRHPAQLYEAIAYFIIFGIMWYIQSKVKSYSDGLYFGICIFSIFTFRFFVEFIKERQVDFENYMMIDMGQVLSIPFIILGLYFIIRGLKKPSAERR